MQSIRTTAHKYFEIILFLFIAFFSFSFSQANAYPAPKFAPTTKVCTSTFNGATVTLFFAQISGPSPEDVVSLTATGPSGTFSLSPSKTIREFGMYYLYVEQSIVANGRYTFEVEDTQGHTATLVRDFTLNSTLPYVNSATMSPANWSYVGTTTPTLSFDSVSGAKYYQVIVTDWDENAQWCAGPIGTETSISVPSGLLQPNTPYHWHVRVWDSKTSPQNYTMSTEVFSFYTGTKADPELSAGGVITMPIGENLLNFFYAFADNVAPWDIDYFKVTGPDSAVLALAFSRGYDFQKPVFNQATIYLDPPTQSVPDGAYTVEIADKSGHTATATGTYAYNPVPDFSADSRVPANNAYFNTDTPTFSWARVIGDAGDGSYRYSIRIMDYAYKVRWYDAPFSADTSFTLPSNLHLPTGSSYHWRVNVYGPAGTGGTNSNNYRMSDWRTFTVNAIAYVNKDDATCGGNSPCYTSIQTAINEASGCADIRIAQGTYNESIVLNTSKSLTLQGGWGSSFLTQTSNTTFIKAPSAPQGSLTLQMLTIKP